MVNYKTNPQNPPNKISNSICLLKIANIIFDQDTGQFPNEPTKYTHQNS